jgi:hypothetical protein
MPDPHPPPAEGPVSHLDRQGAPRPPVRAEEAQGPPQLHTVRVLQKVARHVAEVVRVQREGLHRTVHKDCPQRRGVVLLGPGEKTETLMRNSSAFAREDSWALRGTSLRIRADRSENKDDASKKTATAFLFSENIVLVGQAGCLY